MVTPQQQSETGAKREKIHGPYGARFDLLFSNDVALRRLAETFGEGFKKYGADNWKNGFPVSELFNHATIHLGQWIDGDTSEDHLAHAVWNLMAIMWQEEKKPELIDYPENHPLRKAIATLQKSPWHPHSRYSGMSMSNPQCCNCGRDVMEHEVQTNRCPNIPLIAPGDGNHEI